jgi:beta-glucanase (GH16 family)
MSLKKMEDPLRMAKIQDGQLLIKMIVRVSFLASRSIPVPSVVVSKLTTLFYRFADTNSALHYYKSENVKTSNGVLNITTNFADNDYKAFNEKTKKFYHDTKHVQTAMVQGWNKFCLTGGIVEYSAKLPGKGATGGLWPACK